MAKGNGKNPSKPTPKKGAGAGKNSAPPAPEFPSQESHQNQTNAGGNSTNNNTVNVNLPESLFDRHQKGLIEEGGFKSWALDLLKNPSKLRDWAIAIFFLWGFLTGGITVKDLIQMIKGEKKESTSETSPPQKP